MEVEVEVEVMVVLSLVRVIQCVSLKHTRTRQCSVVALALPIS